jgi:hypothetical protein
MLTVSGLSWERTIVQVGELSQRCTSMSSFPLTEKATSHSKVNLERKMDFIVSHFQASLYLSTDELDC